MKKIEDFSKYSELIYKKMVILLAVCAGSGSYAIKFLLTKSFIYGFSLLIIFGVVSYGVFLNYMKLKNIEDIFEELLDV